jgi:hypothetical protein
MTARRTTTETVVLASIDHAATSHNGNPTYRLTCDDGRTYLTETDGGVGYEATNYRSGYRRHDPRIVLTIGARGRVVGMEWATTL